jgi:integrase
MRRKYGHANVEEHPKGSEQYRVRARIGGRLVTVAKRLDEKTAKATADAYGQLRQEGEVREGITLDQFGSGFLDRRERRKVRAVAKDRSRWKTHITEDPIGAIALRLLRRSDVVEWRDRLEGKGLAVQTIRNCRNLLSVALSEALDRELVDQNVARDVRVSRAASATSKEDLEGILNPEEQEKLIRAVPEAYQPMVEFALFTGLRWAELSWLKIDDVEGERIVVRRSTGGGPTKSGKPRRVPLSPQAHGALVAQIKSIKSSQWVFPSEDGRPRQNRPNAWPEWVKAAELGRHIRWHDLRHTCATSLLAGWWGEKWTLEEVCGMLGHASKTTTERYARKLDETIEDAAKKKFPGGNGSGGSGGKYSGAFAFLNRRSVVRFNSGAPQKNSQKSSADSSSLGTSGELPRTLKRALKRTSPRSREGVQVRRVAAAYIGAVAGDEGRTVRELRRLAKGGAA